MTQKQIIRLLNDWLKQKGNTKAKLAKKLGYKTHTTINNWIKRKSIPSYRLNDILKEITNVNA